MLRHLLANSSDNFKASVTEKDILANSLAITLPTAAVSAVIYGLRGNLSGVDLSVYVLPAIIGGIFGAHLLNKLNRKIISLIFAVLVIYSGVSMLF